MSASEKKISTLGKIPSKDSVSSEYRERHTCVRNASGECILLLRDSNQTKCSCECVCVCSGVNAPICNLFIGISYTPRSRYLAHSPRELAFHSQVALSRAPDLSPLLESLSLPRSCLLSFSGRFTLRGCVCVCVTVVCVCM